MAMTKAERAAMEALRIKASLCWPQFERPTPISLAEIAVATKGGKAFRAWWVIPARGVAGVGEGVVYNGYHSATNYTDEQLADHYKSGSRVVMSQTIGGPWFHDREDALRELHWRIAEECAGKLAAVAALTAPAE